MHGRASTGTTHSSASRTSTGTRLYRVYRPQVTAATTDEELWNIILSMLRNLNDDHVCLSDEKRRNCGGVQDAREPDDFSLDLVRSKYLKGGATDTLKGSFTYGWLADGIGYMHFSHFKAGAGPTDPGARRGSREARRRPGHGRRRARQSGRLGQNGGVRGEPVRRPQAELHADADALRPQARRPVAGGVPLRRARRPGAVHAAHDSPRAPPQREQRRHLRAGHARASPRHLRRGSHRGRPLGAVPGQDAERLDPVDRLQGYSGRKRRLLGRDRRASRHANGEHA